MHLVHVKTDGRLPTSTFALFDGELEVGFTQVRHQASHASDIPAECANHIYYEINQEFRQQGYGTEILKLALNEARRIGLQEIIVCCDRSNEASHRIIQKNGGLFSGAYLSGDNEEVLKYVFK